MTTWGLVAEYTVGMGENKHLVAHVIGHVEGTREEAMEALHRRARHYRPEHPRSPRRRRLFRTGEGFLLVVDGSYETFGTRFQVAELLEDSEAPAEPPERPAPAEESVEPDPEVPDVERYPDGVPVKPAWLGRTDLP
ncbi:hypothetical protein FM076_08870 [Streptomyces albus subsp. chlorinus]|uniref:hypothetical protein n=1 Tax=Streptomyces albus TaxID=1888 RepID=UPI0015704004|nr:hypothetical protein [Streptomyces albus]NSC21315.1 hypothetical protein [Streptomyces albus subsp. chlorinus]